MTAPAIPDDRATKLYGPPPEPRKRKTAGPRDGVVRLSDLTAKPIRWLWPGWVQAGALAMLDGDPGVGKSSVATDLITRLTAGRPWPDGQRSRRGCALVMTAEEGLADTVLPRVAQGGGDPSRVFVLTHIPTVGGPRLPSLPGDIDYLEQVIRDHRIRLVVIDVLASYLGGQRDVNSHQDTDVRRAMYPLYLAADRTGCAVLMLRHLNKQSGNTAAIYRGGGSIGIGGQARSVLLAAYDPSDPAGQRRILAPVKVNNAPLPRALAYQLAAEPGELARVHWRGEDSHSAAELLAEPESADTRDERDHVVAWVQDYLARAGDDASAAYTQIMAAARQAGISERTLRGARRRAEVTYRRAGWQAGTVWVLDPETAARLRDTGDLPQQPLPGMQRDELTADPAIEAIEAAPPDAAPMASMEESPQ